MAEPMRPTPRDKDEIYANSYDFVVQLFGPMTGMADAAVQAHGLGLATELSAGIGGEAELNVRIAGTPSDAGHPREALRKLGEFLKDFS